MDGALEFDEHGRESNSNKANNGFHNKIAPASGDSFLWVLSLSVQRKYLASSRSENKIKREPRWGKKTTISLVDTHMPSLLQ